MLAGSTVDLRMKRPRKSQLSVHSLLSFVDFELSSCVIAADLVAGVSDPVMVNTQILLVKPEGFLVYLNDTSKLPYPTLTLPYL